MEAQALFNGEGLMPKQETQAWDFLKANPKFDGRDVVVAIFDSGVDPNAAGMQKTSTGKRKVIEVRDCSGSGDVDTSVVRKAENGTLTCLSGRVLDVSAFEAAQNNEYRVGVKRGYELMPKSLVTRMTAKRQENFEKVHRAHLNGLQAELSEWQARFTRVVNGESVDVSQEMTEEEQATKAELVAQIEQATSLMSSWSDPGPLLDVIAWRSTSDGQWRVIVDTTETADATKLVPMKTFSESGDTGSFGGENMMNYSVNVWGDGSIVEIVANSGSHGTHVGGIVGAYFGDGDPNNGVAPGCQLVSLKIGDGRLGTMETGTAIVRALIAARELKVDVINMSYGEPAATPNAGRITELINELVTKHGVIFVTSASNSGPCLTTIGAPGATATGTIAVAAVVSPAMMEQQYSMRDASSRTLMPYNWSSRGPSLDGSYGPSIAAPGGAIAPVPTWTLQKNQLMNGTSMASPNAAGCVTLLLSALKQSGIKYSPYLVRLAIENSAKSMPDCDFTAVGHGLIQVDSAFQFYMDYCRQLSPNVSVRASVTSRGGQRGIILRDTDHFAFPEIEEVIEVIPTFAEDTPAEEKINFDTRFELRATVPWITTPTYFQLPNGGRSFKVHIRAPHLPADRANEGVYYLGEIHGIDLANPDLGPVFKVPVTIIRGVQVGPSTHRKFEYKDLATGPGVTYRRFFQVPVGATWATITINTKGWPYARMALLSCQQVVPDQSHKFTLLDKYFSMKGDDERVVRMPLVAGLTFEVVVGQFWSAVGSEGTISFCVEFNGVTVDGSFAASSFSEIQRVRIHNSLGTNTIQLRPTLSAISRTLPPASTSPITPLYKDRDMLADGNLIYQMVLTYHYTADDSKSKILLRSPFSTMLYDSPFESQLIMVYDANKTLVATVDYNPEWLTLPSKGAYKFRMQLRHNNSSILEKFKNVTLNVEKQLAKPITLSAWPLLGPAMSGGRKFPEAGTKYTTAAHFAAYIQAPTAPSQLPSYAKHGDVMYGYMSLAKFTDQPKDKDAFADCGLNPYAAAVVPIQFVVPHKSTSGPASPEGKASANSNAAAMGSALQLPTTLLVSPGPPPTPKTQAPSVPAAISSPIRAPKPSPMPLVPISTSSTPSASPAVSAPATPAAPSESPSPAPSSSTSTDVSPQQAESAAAPSSTALPKALDLLLNSAITHLWTLITSEKWEDWTTLTSEYKRILPSLVEDSEFRMQHLLYCDAMYLKSASNDAHADAATALLNAAEALMGDIDTTALAVYCGTRHPNETPAERQQQERTAVKLVTALSRKARALGKAHADYAAIVAEISKWTDPAPLLQALKIQDSPSSPQSQQPPQHAIELRALRKKIAAGEKPTQAQSTEMISLLKSLGWTHWAQHLQEWHYLRFNMDYVPF